MPESWGVQLISMVWWEVICSYADMKWTSVVLACPAWESGPWVHGEHPACATMGPPMMGLAHSSVGMGCSGTVGLRSGDWLAELLGQILCRAWWRAGLAWGRAFALPCSFCHFHSLWWELIGKRKLQHTEVTGVHVLSCELAVGIELHPWLLVSPGFLPLPGPLCSRAGKTVSLWAEVQGWDTVPALVWGPGPWTPSGAFL